MKAKQRVHLFIDTNIFLGFYAYTSDDVEELKKLTKLITTEQLKLYLPEQVRHEFYRNREARLRGSLKTFQPVPGSASVPRFMAAYPSIRVYRRAWEDLLKARDDAIQLAKKEAETNSIAADILFAEIAKAAGLIRMTNKILAAATRRMNLGNPPGKPGSLGDRVNWETLLEKAPDGTDLHLISKDGDFGSPLQTGAPDGYLVEEWRSRKHGRLALHDQLKPFLAQFFPHIQLAIDVEKRAALDHLINSGNFATTHAAISGLQSFLDVLTPSEIQESIKAAEDNSQIGWIVQDPDVRRFYTRVIDALRSGGNIGDEEYSRLLSEFGIEGSPKCSRCGAPNALEAVEGTYLCDKCYGAWIDTRETIN